MWKIILSILFVCQLSAETVNLDKFTGGLNTRLSPILLPNESSPDCQNVLFDEVGGVTRRNGYKYKGYSSTNTIGKRLFPYAKSSGAKYLFKQVEGGLYKTISGADDSWTLLRSGLKWEQNYLDSAIIENLRVFTNGIDPVFSSDGKSYTEYSFIKRGKYITSKSEGTSGILYDRTFIANTYAYASGVYYSDTEYSITNSNAWAENQIFLVGANDGEWITALYVWRGDLYIFKTHSVWRLDGSYPNWVLRRLTREYGCFEQDTIQEKDNMLIFLSKDRRAVVGFDGSFFTELSLPIEPDLDGWDNFDGYYNYWIQSTIADFEAGTSTGNTVGEELQLEDLTKVWKSSDTHPTAFSTSTVLFSTSAFSNTKYSDSGVVLITTVTDTSGTDIAFSVDRIVLNCVQTEGSNWNNLSEFDKDGKTLALETKNQEHIIKLIEEEDGEWADLNACGFVNMPDPFSDSLDDFGEIEDSYIALCERTIIYPDRGTGGVHPEFSIETSFTSEKDISIFEFDIDYAVLLYKTNVGKYGSVNIDFSKQLITEVELLGFSEDKGWHSLATKSYYKEYSYDNLETSDLANSASAFVYSQRLTDSIDCSFTAYDITKTKAKISFYFDELNTDLWGCGILQSIWYLNFLKQADTNVYNSTGTQTTEQHIFDTSVYLSTFTTVVDGIALEYGTTIWHQILSSKDNTPQYISDGQAIPSVYSPCTWVQVISSFSANEISVGISSKTPVLQSMSVGAKKSTSTWKSDNFQVDEITGWKYFITDDYKPTGTGISYAVATATGETALSTVASWDWIDSGDILDAGLHPSTHTWIVAKATMSTTDGRVSPMVNSITVTWYPESEPIRITSEIVDKRYWLGVSTYTGYNDNIYVLDKNMKWTRFSGYTPADIVNWKGVTYVLDASTDAIWQADYGNADRWRSGTSSSPIVSYWTSKPLFLALNKQSSLDYIYTSLKPAGGDITAGYALYDDSFTEYTIDLSGSREINDRARISSGEMGKVWQLKFSNTSTVGNWELHNIGLYFSIKPLRGNK